MCRAGLFSRKIGELNRFLYRAAQAGAFSMGLARLLRDIHQFQTRASELREGIARGPKQVGAAEAGLKKFEDDWQKSKDIARQCKIGADEKQLQLRQREAKQADLKGKLMQAESNTVYQSLKDQIAADEKANSVLADEILEALERLDELNAKSRETEGNVAKAKEELERVKTRVNQQRAGLEGQLEQVLADLHTAEAKLPEDYRQEYFRVAKSKAEESLAPVEGESCGGCFQMLPPQMVAEVRAGKPTFCKTCGRLLYDSRDE